MPEKNILSADQIVLGKEISLDEWLHYLDTDKKVRVFPNNCFPTAQHKSEYLSRANDIDELSIRRLARHFLNKSANYGVDSDRFRYVVQNYDVHAFERDDFNSEFDRRSVPINGPQWEGITWILDLLPKNPLGAINSLRSYMQAHLLYFTDQMIYGHHDVIDIIKARYKIVNRLSCFISYGRPDEAFASRIFDSLTQNGVQTFFFPTHAMPGKKLHKVMREGVNQYDRIILICSKASLNRLGVLNELSETLQREARDGGKDYLIPIRLDDYVFTDWAPDDPQLAQAVRDRVVADFSKASGDEEQYEVALKNLIVALEQPFTS
ncbi:toll/interleukin-1 receptor domain-containing protein [Bremerella sp. T1]|uniref:toll/interleukin-1 receptor domain-containing protein n=1 Tax=Bremerella sp. TYQ1 TaxID=3119568 RepID=UPI001CCD3E12|nr:toll/interleukin-1 receptor domain-containing protein [Bremerella volcania]UBM38065.1 toll/interleukin-1 receptor domain-containing protein [Bremerella volcania]